MSETTQQTGDIPGTTGSGTTSQGSTAADTGATEQTTLPTPEEAAAAVAAAQKETEKWQALARKHEERAKTNAEAARELDKVKQSQMTETERAVSEARADERRTVLAEVGSRFVDAEFKVAAAGRTVNGKPIDLDAVLAGVNRTAFLGDDGEVDTAKVARFIDGIAPKQDDSQTTQQRQFAADLGQGKRNRADASTADQFAGAVEGFLRG